MSLLMDALKKAEREKREAAERLKEAQGQTGNELELAAEKKPEIPDQPPSELREPVAREEPDTKSPDPATEVTITSEIPVESPEDVPPASSLSLEPVGGEESQAPEQEDESTSLDDEPIAPEPAEVYEYIETSWSDKAEKEKPDLDQTEEATKQPSFEETVQSVIPDDFAESISDTQVTRTIVSAAELVSDIGGGKDQPTPVAAQTVFTAIGAARSEQAFKWMTLLVLCMVIAVSFSVLYYFSITPLSRELSSPLVAKGIESEPVAPPVIDIPQEVLMSEVDDVTGDTVTEQPSVADGDAPIVEPVDETQVIAVEMTLPEQIEVEPRAIEISRSIPDDTYGELIRSAYADYLAGNLTSAESKYQKVLQNLLDNRDALLGLASIAHKKGDLQNAYGGYLNVLRLYPRDNYARTMLINMQGIDDPVKTESIVKLMIERESESSYLYYTLGKLYAGQSRWASAQQAFFEAYRLETNNPDYAFNLAVSLDHIGQGDTALDYYNVALELADDTGVSFNTSIVLSRIKTLSTVNSN